MGWSRSPSWQRPQVQSADCIALFYQNSRVCVCMVFSYLFFVILNIERALFRRRRYSDRRCTCVRVCACWVVRHTYMHIICALRSDRAQHEEFILWGIDSRIAAAAATAATTDQTIVRGPNYLIVYYDTLRLAQGTRLKNKPHEHAHTHTTITGAHKWLFGRFDGKSDGRMQNTTW